MGPYLWCALGAVLGWIASLMLQPKGFVPTVESVGVGVFGAFLGGEFLPAMLLVVPAGGLGMTPATVSMSIASAMFCLFLLVLLRRTVGPLKPHKKTRSA